MRRYLFILVAVAVSLLAVGGYGAHAAEGGQRVDAREVPFTFEGNHIALWVTLNGRGPYCFYLDTGASNMMTPDVAQLLHVRQLPGGKIGGFGANRVDTSSAIVASLQFGEVYLAHQDFKILQLPSNLTDRGNRPSLSGVIGGDFLKDYVARIDFDRRVATFFPKDRFTYTGTGQPLDLTFWKARSIEGEVLQRPEVSATVDGKASTFLLDTGNSGSVIFFPGSARAQELLAKPGDRLHAVMPGGIGGHIEVDMIRVDGVALAGIPSATGGTPAIGVVTGANGAVANGDLVGALGMGMLEQFNLTIDYARNKIYLEPRPSLPKREKSAPLRGTGLEMSKDAHDRFTVIGTIAGSPAEKAGIVAGNEVFAIDGKPATDMAQFDYRPIERTALPVTVLLGPPGNGRTVTLEKQILLP